MVNSYREEISDISDDDDDEDGDEEKPKKPKRKVVKATSVKRQMMMIQRKLDGKRKKKRRPVMNVFCTQYDIVKKVAKVYQDYILKERREDHEGGINKQGQNAQKLSMDWDVTWHDLGITPDFFAKMQPYQKVN
mmetsp:Transcript_42231/g.64740  ORF Transcript_42231/g.64740 Transcript_42231/m.64740 type:complete len:134 (-) Transcript_42231:4530-4931(-)